MTKEIKLLILLLFCCLQSCIAQKEKLNLNIENELEMIRLDQTKQQSIIYGLNERIIATEANKSFFNTNLKTQTGIFTVIVSLAMFIIGWLIPRYLRKEYEIRIETIQSNFTVRVEDLENQILNISEMITLANTKSKKRDKIVTAERLNMKRHNCKTMYHIATSQDMESAAFLWAFRLVECQLSFKVNSESNFIEKDEFISDYLEHSFEHIQKAISNHENEKFDLSENHFQEVTEKASYLKENLTINSDIQILEKTMLMLNKHYYKMK